MNIQQLFRNSNPEIIFIAYVLEPIFSETCELSLQDRARALGKLRTHIKNTVHRFRDCEIDCPEPYTLFLTDHLDPDCPSLYNTPDVFCVNDQEALSVVGKDFSMWDDSGDFRLEHYGIDFVSVEDLAGYTIASGLDVKYGAEVCCAAILREYFVWGYDDESREECLAMIREALEEEPSDCSCSSDVDEVFSSLEEKYNQFLSEDDLERLRLYQAYKESVSDIEARQRISAMDQMHRKCIDAVTTEFSTRF